MRKNEGDNDQRPVKESPDQFIAEVGKGVVNLVNEPPCGLLKWLREISVPECKRSHLSVENAAGNARQVEMPHGFRRAKLIKGQRIYRSSTASMIPVKVIIRETYQHPSQAGRASFPPKAPAEGFHAHIRDSLLRSDSEEEYLEDLEEIEEGTGEESEIVPEGFSIYEEGVADAADRLQEDLLEEP
jgi:hypothetical protein